MQKTENKMKKLTDKTARYHSLWGKVGFVKVVWKEMFMDISVFM